MAKEKLTEKIPEFRSGETLKKYYQQKADEDHRRLTEYIRIRLEQLMDDELKK